MLDRPVFVAAARIALSRFPVVALLGPRQVGKTTLAKEVARSMAPDRTQYLDLEFPADRNRLTDPAEYFEAHRGSLIILDEIQWVPELFPILRGVVDRRREAGERFGQFLVLGSASMDLLRQSSESLAGRISQLELPPIGLGEVPDTTADLDQLWRRGGFPDSLLASDDDASLAWRRAFIRTYLERDIPMFQPRVPSETLRRFWTMLAHNQGQQLNAARLAAGLGVSGQTVARYLDLMVDLLLVRRLPPWSGNVGKRLVKSPKVYVRDSGLVHALLGIGTQDDLLGHPVVGGSWEGFVLETLIAGAGDRSLSFYRTARGAEIDLVVEGLDGRRLAVEIKRSSAPTVSRGFRIGCEDLGVAEAVVVYPGVERFPLGGGVTAMGPAAAAQWLGGA
ncbi:MAG: ATP-binding protein [Gemmatimonadetes bacterium]|nr:ATP-binding protein [Gemmatimonadota bacterium]